MKSKKLRDRFFILLALAILTTLVGCVQQALAPNPSDTPDQSISPPSEMTRPTPPAVSISELEELTAGNGEFAFDLYQALRDQKGNLFLSPYSISAALAMAFSGAWGNTEQQMAETLRFTLPQDRLHPAFRALEGKLDTQTEAGDEAFQLNIAQSLWGQEGFPFRPDFTDVLAGNYKADIELVDFIDERQREAARLDINRWVEDETQNKIRELIQPGTLNEFTRLVLANAIYFQGEWVEPFHAEASDLPFTRTDGSQINVPMMSRRMETPYFEGENYQAVELAYKGDRISMVVLLPADGQLEAFEESLSHEKVDSILKDLQPQDIKLYIPKFSFSSKLLLENQLPSMGMPDAFDPQKADFTGMYDPVKSPGRLFISHVVHQAFVAVDENGTEAAAATGVTVEIVSEPVVLRVDRTFIFLIRDRTTGTILFLGRVVDPSISQH